MSNKNSYSLCFKDDALVGMSVSPVEPSRWRIECIDRNDGQGEPCFPAQELSKNSDRVAMVVSGNAVSTSLITLPKLKKKETNLAVSGWVAREESTPVDEWCVSWREHKSGRADKPDKKDIFLLYASKKDVDQQLASARERGAEPSSMLPDFMILDSMFRQHYPDSGKLEAWNIVFIGKDDHFLCVSNQAGLLLTRQLPADLSDGSDAGEYMERLATEVDRSIFFARQTEFNPDIQKIIVCGDSELAHDLVEKLKDETTIPAEHWDVGELFQWEAEKLDSRLLLPAMTAALASEKPLFNLLPHHGRTLLGPVALRRVGLAASTAFVAIVPLLIAGGIVTADVQDRYLDRARLQLREAEIRADKAAEIYEAQRVLIAREDHIVSFTEKDADYAGVLLHLANLTPEQIIYQDLRLKETNTGQVVLYLSGESSADTVAEAQKSFLEFQQALNSSVQLVAVGEPKKLLINSQIVQDEEVKRVEFSMEYRVELQTQPSGAVASVVARTER